MDTPERFKPNCDPTQIQSPLSHKGYPAPINIEPVAIPSGFHQIFVLEFLESSLKDFYGEKVRYGEHLLQYSLPDSLVLRVAGSHMPYTKMMNEVAMLKWLATETTIPVPHVLEYSTSSENALNHEYMLMTCSRGVNASTVRDEFSESQIQSLVDQLTHFLLQLYSRPFQHIGGLRLREDGAVTPGPPCDETMWMIPDVIQYFGSTESFSTLNPTRNDGYLSFTEWIAAYVECYIHAIEASPSLNSWIDSRMIQRLCDFLLFIRLPTSTDAYNQVDLILAHRDLHLGQILVDVSGPTQDELRITAILDWEFAQIIPFPLWRRSFLWNANFKQTREEPGRDRVHLNDMWNHRTYDTEAGRVMLGAEQWRYDEQQLIWYVCNYLRCIVEVRPRGKQLDDARLWWGKVSDTLVRLGIS